MKKVLKLSVWLCLLLGLTSAMKLDKFEKDRKLICTLQPVYGTCDKFQMKWYYDFEHDRCLQFVYSSCGGNVNRFDNRQSCTTYCMHPNHRYIMQDFEDDVLGYS